MLGTFSSRVELKRALKDFDHLVMFNFLGHEVERILRWSLEDRLHQG